MTGLLAYKPKGVSIPVETLKKAANYQRYSVSVLYTAIKNGRVFWESELFHNFSDIKNLEELNSPDVETVFFFSGVYSNVETESAFHLCRKNDKSKDWVYFGMEGHMALFTSSNEPKAFYENFVRQDVSAEGVVKLIEGLDKLGKLGKTILVKTGVVSMLGKWIETDGYFLSNESHKYHTGSSYYGGGYTPPSTSSSSSYALKKSENMPLTKKFKDFTVGISPRGMLLYYNLNDLAALGKPICYIDDVEASFTVKDDISEPIIEPMDIITSLRTSNRSIKNPNFTDITSAIEEAESGDFLELTVYRFDEGTNENRREITIRVYDSDDCSCTSLSKEEREEAIRKINIYDIMESFAVSWDAAETLYNEHLKGKSIDVGFAIKHYHSVSDDVIMKELQRYENGQYTGIEH